MCTFWKALILTLSDVMINCNCFNDRDHSLLVLNEVSDSYLKLWMNCYFSIRNHMTIYIYQYVAIIRMISMPSCPYFILSTPLSLNMWTYFSLSASLEDKQGLSLGELICPFCIMLLYRYFITLWAVTSRYVTILMPILSYFTRFTWRGRMPTVGILGWKRSKC